jgi:hypothetical protein
MASSLPSGLVPLGDLDHPVPAGEAFARIQPEAESDLAELKPGPDDNWTREKDGTLRAALLGLVETTPNGLRVRPLWTVSEDRMALGVDLYPVDFAGKPITLQQVGLSITGKFGSIPLDTEALARVLAQVLKSGEPALGCVVSRGQPAIPGENGRLELFFKHGKAVGKLREDGTMDYREREVFQQVAEGALLARLHPPTKAKPGSDIFGKPQAAPDGKPLAVKAGDGVSEKRQEGGGSEFVATCGGIPDLSKGTLRVSAILTVPGDVDLDSGNITAPQGSVEVRGSVRSGFAVNAGKDVMVKDTVESADILAGGDVTVQGGILMGGENLVRAGGIVRAKFIQNAVVRAEGDVLTTGDITASDILSRGKVVVNGGNGNVVGGVVRCRTGLVARELGGDTGVATRIEIFVEGPRTPELMARKEALEAHLAKLAKGIGSEDALSVLMAAPEEDRRILAELIKIKSQDQTDLKTVEQELTDDLLIGEKDLESVGVQATGTVFPGVEISMGRRLLTIDARMPAAHFRWNPSTRNIETE